MFLLSLTPVLEESRQSTVGPPVPNGTFGRAVNSRQLVIGSRLVIAKYNEINHFQVINIKVSIQ